ncbi:GHKL domain-containing protein [Hymenobacter sp. BT491]|nr:GHKL domain-containing protein [Hymenobacter sp. BT491]
MADNQYLDYSAARRMKRFVLCSLLAYSAPVAAWYRVPGRRWAACWAWVGLLAMGTPVPAQAQSPYTATLQRALRQAPADTSRVLLLADISTTFRYSLPDSALWYAQRGLRLARRIKYPKGQGRCLARIGYVLAEKGNLPLGLRTELRALQLNQNSHDRLGEARTLLLIGLSYSNSTDYTQALRYFHRAKKLYDAQISVNEQDTQLLIAEKGVLLHNIGASYTMRNQLDSARYFEQKALQLIRGHAGLAQTSSGNPLPLVLRGLGLIYARANRDDLALRYYRRSVAAALPDNNLRATCRTYNALAELFWKRHQLDSCRYYAHQTLTIGRAKSWMVEVLGASTLLAQVFEASGKADSTLAYVQLMQTAKDSLYSPRRMRELTAVSIAEQQQRLKVEAEGERFRRRVRLYALLSGLGVLLLLALGLWLTVRRKQRTNRHLQTLNRRVNQQKKTLTKQRDDLSKALAEVTTMQTQLIQSAKMASLGELAAGIAHEIQNPLNFVTNFAEVSREMLDDLKADVVADRKEEALSAADDLSQTLQKIKHHGHRAASIVKGMLGHSRASSGVREPTDLNTLAEECLRLAYEGRRAKDKGFHAACVPDLDPALGLVTVVPQDLGRVLLNLLTNAFYAVSEKSRRHPQGYQPEVKICTRRQSKQVEIVVRDNGLGIPEAVRAKIFQPFFTTKPTGEGTGLGLSLSYDIITKGHGGTLTIDSREGEYTEVAILLPNEPESHSATPLVDKVYD